MKITKRQLRRLIKEEISKVLSEHEEESGRSWLEDIVQGEFDAWLDEQNADRNKFQPGLGAGGNEGKAATQRSQVFYKVKRVLMQAPYDYIDDVAAYYLDKEGEEYDKKKVIGVGKPIYNEIYAILYKLIPRSGY